MNEFCELVLPLSFVKLTVVWFESRSYIAPLRFGVTLLFVAKCENTVLAASPSSFSEKMLEVSYIEFL